MMRRTIYFLIVLVVCIFLFTSMVDANTIIKENVISNNKHGYIEFFDEYGDSTNLVYFTGEVKKVTKIFRNHSNAYILATNGQENYKFNLLDNNNHSFKINSFNSKEETGQAIMKAREKIVPEVYDKKADLIQNNGEVVKVQYSRIVTLDDGTIAFKIKDGWYRHNGAYKLVK